MNGCIHYLLNNYEEIRLIVKDHNMKTVEKMYEGYPKITLEPFPCKFGTLDVDALISTIKTNLAKGYSYLGFGVHGNNQNYISLDKCWANCFYMQYGLPKEIRWTHFKFPQSLEKGKELAEAVMRRIGSQYIVLHDDPSRGFKLDHSVVMQTLQKDGLESLPIVYIGKNRYSYPLVEGANNPEIPELSTTETLYDYCYLLANAQSCHMMDSSCALLLDYMQTRPEQKKYMHEYAKAQEILSTEGLFQQTWHTLR
jgi:hypothetical protein